MSQKKPLVDFHERVVWGQTEVGVTGGKEICKIAHIGWGVQRAGV
jgi:hypothetical protein